MATETLTARSVLSTGQVVTKTSTIDVATAPAPTSSLILGCSMSTEPGHEPYPWEAARYYALSRASHAINNHRSRIHLFSSPQSKMAWNTTTWVNGMNSIRTQCAQAGITNVEIHCGAENEANREFTTSATIASYKAWFKDLSQALRSVPGCTTWMNLTRWGIGEGTVDPFVTDDMLPYIDGLAINCYDPGMEKNPIVYSKDFESWMGPMFDWIEGTGITQVSGWETGTRTDARGLRPQHARDLARAYRDLAQSRGLTPRVLAWWDNVTTATRDCRFHLDGTATVEAWRGALS